MFKRPIIRRLARTTLMPLAAGVRPRRRSIYRTPGGQVVRSIGGRGRSARVRVLSAVVTILTAVTAGALSFAAPAAADYAADCRAGGAHNWYFETVYGVPAYTTGNVAFVNGEYCQIGKAKLIMQNGDLYVYDERGRVRWRASWENSQVRGNGSHMVMQLDGNFVMYDSGFRALWASNTYTGLEGRLAVQADGNVVVYTPGWRPGWSSRSAH
jgi:hypothetical protein